MSELYQRVAYALVALDMQVTHRRTLRAMLPAGSSRRPSVSRQLRLAGRGKGKGCINRVTQSFHKALKRFEVDGWVMRGQEFIFVKDRDALLACAAGQSFGVDFEHVSTVIRADLAEADGRPVSWVQQRQAELQAVESRWKAEKS